MELKQNRFLFIYLLFMSFTGVGLLKINNAYITPFYFLSILFLLNQTFRKNTLKIKKEQKRFIVLLVTLFASFMISYNNYNVISFLHTLYYWLIAYFLIKVSINKNFIIKLNKTILLVYFLNVCLSHVLYLLNFQIDYLNKIIFIQGLDTLGNYRFSGFATEPSHLALIITTSVLILIYLNKEMSIKYISKYLVIYLLTIILAKTGYGIVCLIIVIVYILILYVKKIPFILVGLSLIALFFFDWIDRTSFNRVLSLFSLVGKSQDLTAFAMDLKFIDGSIGYRIIPIIKYFSTINLFDLHFWFGNGSSTLKEFIGSLFNYDSQVIEEVGGQFFPGFFYINGIFAGVLVINIIFTYIRKLPFVFLLFTIVTISNTNFSNQIFWFIFIQLIWLSKLSNFFFNPISINDIN